MQIVAAFGRGTKWLALVLLLIVAITRTAKATSERDDATTRTRSVDDEKVLEEAAEFAQSESHELSDEALGSIIKDFSQVIGDTMKEEVGKLIEEVGHKQEAAGGSGQQAAPVDRSELTRFKEANEALSQDTQTRIEMAGQKNRGEMTRSVMGDKAQSYLAQVSGKLQTAGAFIGQQMSSLVGMAPTLRGQIRAVPGKLRKLMRWPTFLRYKIQYNKVYKSLREELYRQMIYLRTQTLVGVQNLKYLVGKVTHLLKATQFADMTDREFHDTYNNPEAKRENEALRAGEKLAPEAKLKMQQLAKEKKNIFGQDLEQLTRHHEAAQAQALTKRRKREALSFVENSELDEDEEMEDAFESEPQGGKVGASAEPMDEDAELTNELDEFSVVDEYAAELDEGAQLEDMDELDELMDEALDSDKREPFKGVDLRKSGCLPEIENQDKCGACYAYVVTAAASYYNCMQQVSTKRLNSRFLSDCGRYMAREGEEGKIKGCRGGFLTHAFEFTKQAGAYPFSFYEVARVSFNYTSDYCAYPRPESIESWAPIQVPFFKQTRVVYLQPKELDLHLRTIGPVFLNIRIWPNFKDQGSGIYDGLEESKEPIVHSMMIVGHDKDAHGRDYWILWNSHGIAWGEKGFARIYHESLEYYTQYHGGLMSIDAVNSNKLG